MKVFISWSGERSRAIAEAIRRWLPGVLQAVKPYFSPDDIAKGARWSSEIAKELEISKLGLLILTPENLESAWLMFEAGALAKNLEKSKVCPLLFDLEPTDIKGPLVQFQAARFGADEMKRVVKMINAELGDAALASDVLDSVFGMWWPKLETDIATQIETAPRGQDGSRTERDMLEEVLELSRSMSRDMRLQGDEYHPGAVEELSESFARLVRIAERSPDPELQIIAQSFMRPIEHICLRRGGRRIRPRNMETLIEAREVLMATKRKPPEDEPKP